MMGPEDAQLAAYRRAFEQSPLGTVVLEQVVHPDEASALRKRLRARGFLPYRRLDRGRYELLAEIGEPDLIQNLRRVAAAVTGARLVVAQAEAYRLRHGDYLLESTDLLPPPRRWYELTCDLSAGSSGEAQVVYARRGEHVFVAPQLAGSFALVRRDTEVSRYDRYLNHRIGDRVVHRLRLALVSTEVAETAPPPKAQSSKPQSSWPPKA
ncbi:MAG: hypothetical protein KC731_01930 [Myxococcales bacterium]|nr:hypothetical protein [Myxococcales bacterium]